jgi:hypothetical protein
MKKVIISLLAAVFLFACSNGTDNVPIIGGKLPGKFSATVLSDAMGSNARGVSLGTYTVANSKSIYFLLRNVGDFPITNVALTPGKLNKDGGAFVPITDGGITASPGTIAVLETSGNATVETVIEVDINHGNIIGLISQQYIQKADFAGATLRITGKTTDEAGTALDVSLDADIETLIKVASFEVVYSLDNGATYQKAGFDSNNRFTVPSAGKDYIKILNTGNVPLRYKSIKRETMTGDWEFNLEWTIIGTGSYSNSLTIGYSMGNIFVVDTIGVAFDNGGIDSFVFRPNTSTVVNSKADGGNYMSVGTN